MLSARRGAGEDDGGKDMGEDEAAGADRVLPATGRTIKAVVLAAGASRRLGRPKQLERWRGKALIAHAVDAVVGAAPDLAPVSVVVAPDLRERIADALGARPVHLIDNPASHTGMASSLHLAVADAIKAQADALLILLSDQPLIDASALRRLLQAWATQPERIAASRYGEVTAGVPAILPSARYDALLDLRGDAGARRVLRATAEVELCVVDLPEGALDIDDRADLARLPGD